MLKLFQICDICIKTTCNTEYVYTLMLFSLFLLFCLLFAVSHSLCILVLFSCSCSLALALSCSFALVLSVSLTLAISRSLSRCWLSLYLSLSVLLSCHIVLFPLSFTLSLLCLPSLFGSRCAVLVLHIVLLVQSRKNIGLLLQSVAVSLIWQINLSNLGLW